MPSPRGLPLAKARGWGLKIITQNLGPDFGGLYLASGWSYRVDIWYTGRYKPKVIFKYSLHPLALTYLGNSAGTSLFSLFQIKPIPSSKHNMNLLINICLQVCPSLSN